MNRIRHTIFLVLLTACTYVSTTSRDLDVESPAKTDKAMVTEKNTSTPEPSTTVTNITYND